MNHIHVAKSREVNREGNEFLYWELETPVVKFIPTESDFIFIDIRRNSPQVFTKLLHKGVIIRTGDIFGFPAFLRITIGTATQNERLIASLREVLSFLNALSFQEPHWTGFALGQCCVTRGVRERFEGKRDVKVRRKKET